MRKKQPYYFALMALFFGLLVFGIGYGINSIGSTFSFTSFQDVEKVESQDQIRSGRPLWHALPRFLLPQNSIIFSGL
jgi:hypothetical protein